MRGENKNMIFLIILIFLFLTCHLEKNRGGVEGIYTITVYGFSGAVKEFLISLTLIFFFFLFTLG